jgi:hypothetical protein
MADGLHIKSSILPRKTHLVFRSMSLFVPFCLFLLFVLVFFVLLMVLVAVRIFQDLYL